MESGLIWIKFKDGVSEEEIQAIVASVYTDHSNAIAEAIAEQWGAE